MRLKNKLRLIVGIIALTTLTGGCGKEEAQIPELLEPVSTKTDTAVVMQGTLEDKTFYKGYAIPKTHVIKTTISGEVETYFAYIGKKVKKDEVLLSYNGDNLKEYQDELTKRLAYIEKKEEYEQALLKIEASNCQTDVEVESMASKIETEKKRYEIACKELLDEQAQLNEKRKDATLKSPCDGIIVSDISTYNPGLYEAPFYLEKGDVPFLIAEEDVSYIQVTDLLEKDFEEQMQAVLLVDGKEYELERVSYDKEYYEMMKQRANYTSLSANLPCIFKIKDQDTKDIATYGKNYVIKVSILQKENTLYTSQDAIFNDGNGYYVKRITEKGTEKVPVRVGKKNDYYCEVEGVSEGDILKSKNIYFEDTQSKTVTIKPTHFVYEKEYTTITKNWANYIPVKCPYDNAKLTEFSANDYGYVKKGDVVAKFYVADDPARIKELEDSKAVLNRECNKQIKEISQEIEDLKKDRTEIEKRDKKDPMLYTIDLRIRYLETQAEKISFETDYETQEIDRQIKNVKDKTGIISVKAPVDGFMQIEQGKIDTVYSKGDVVAGITGGNSLMLTFNRTDELAYMQNLKVVSLDPADPYETDARAVVTANILPPDMLGYERFFNRTFATFACASMEEEIDMLYRYDLKATAVLWEAENCYVLDRSMVQEDEKRQFIYILKDGVRIKQFVILSPFMDGKAYVLDGLDPAMGEITVIVN